ncbi:MAG: hypothetical protein PHY92_06900 [Alphaproteobacteria bacterium]|nr:hypothetical protein [Alphaproteobacteria bacterium]
MSELLEKLQTDSGIVHGIPLNYFDEHFLRPVTGGEVRGRGLIMEVWDITHWEIFECMPKGELKSFVPQPLRVRGGTLALIKSGTGIAGGVLAADYRKGESIKGYEITPGNPADFAGLYTVNGSNIATLTTQMVLRVPVNGAADALRGVHRPMGEFRLMERASDGKAFLAGTFVNTNSAPQREHVLSLVSFRKSLTLNLE